MQRIIVFVVILFTAQATLTAQDTSGVSVVDPEQLTAEPAQTPGGSPAAVDLGKKSDKIEFLLTRQGFVQEGIMEIGPKTVYVNLPNQKGGLTISRLDVLCIASTKEELFDYRKSRIRLDDIGELVRLADWGVRHQLTDPAIKMLNEVIIGTSDQAVRDMLAQKIEHMKFVEKIRLEALKRKAQTQETDAAPAPSKEMDELQRIEQWGKNISISTQDRFVRKIQPVLIRNCASEGCHSENKASATFVFHQSLTRSSKRVNGLKNLRTVLARVDLNSPSSSPVLSHPPITDGQGNSRYPFGNGPDTLKDYETFVGWVNSLPKQVAPEAVRTARDNGTSTIGLIAPDRLAPSQGHPAPSQERLAPPLDMPVVPPATSDRPIVSPTSGLTADAQKYIDQERAAMDEKIKRHSLTPPVMPGPKDEFDPVLFNRRYHPEKFK